MSAFVTSSDVEDGMVLGSGIVQILISRRRGGLPKVVVREEVVAIHTVAAEVIENRSVLC